MPSVAYLGNSVTAQRGSYVDPLHRLLSARWGVEGGPRKAGLGGVGSLAVAGLLDYLVLRHRPDVCFVECSLADAGGATPVGRIGVAVESILGDLQSAGVRPVVLHLPRTDVSPKVHQSVVEVYESIAAERSVLCLDLRHVGERGGLPDGVHTSPALSEQIAEAISCELEGVAMVREPEPVGHRGHVVRHVPAAHGRSSGREAQAGTFRLSLDTRVVVRGGALQFEASSGPFLGVYVIARSTSGVIEIQSGGAAMTVQVWDEWCSRARIQFIHVPEELGIGPVLRVAPTDLHTAHRNALGLPTSVAHEGTSVEVVGAAFLTTEDRDVD